MSKEKYFNIEFQPTGKRITSPSGMNVLEAARGSGIGLVSICGGKGLCGRCKIIILEGKVTPLASVEKSILTEKEQASSWRLACCTRPLSDIKVSIPVESVISEARTQISSNLPDIEVEPIVRAYSVGLDPPNLEDLRSDFQRLADKMQQQYGLTNLYADISIVRQLPSKLREENWRVSAFVRGNEIVGLAKYNQDPIGYAVDLGTTKIAAFLVNLNTGDTIASKGKPNPQIDFGEDVINRLSYALKDHKSRKIIAQKVRKELDSLLREMLDETKLEHTQVVETCIVGNTAMSHLLLELPVGQLAVSPFVAAMAQPVSVRAAEIGLNTAVGGYVYLPAVIGGFVGADHVAMLLATGLYQNNKVTLGIDIGTNTEISLYIPDKSYLASASCASGPAFEGAHINDGMRAAAGAIEKVEITEAGVVTRTVADGRPIGLCGSGIIDAIAELYRNGIINERGRFEKRHRLVRVSEKGPEFVLVSSENSGTGKDISVNQEDVNKIQLAKGAINAGINILLDSNGISAAQVEEVIIAGAFGSFINLNNAISIGLFPVLPQAKYRQVGNAALAGAKQMLVSNTARQNAVEIAKNTKYQELTLHPEFKMQFAKGMLFPGESEIRRTLIYENNR